MQILSKIDFENKRFRKQKPEFMLTFIILSTIV